MHIIIGIITALATLAWAIRTLQQSGLTIDSINPFAWYRRTQWKKRYGTKPLYTLENSMDAAAVLIVGIAQLDGDVSREQKRAITTLFENEFELSPDKAQALLSSSTFLLNNEHDLVKHASQVITPSKASFSDRQINSLLQWMEDIASLDTPMNTAQNQLIQAVKRVFGIK